MSAPRIVAAVAAVALLLLAVYRMRSGRPGRAALGVLLAAVLALYSLDLTGALPDGEQAVTEAGDALGDWTYPFMAAMAFLETSIPPVTLGGARRVGRHAWRRHGRRGPGGDPAPARARMAVLRGRRLRRLRCSGAGWGARSCSSTVRPWG